MKVSCVPLTDDFRKFIEHPMSDRWMFLKALVLLGVMRVAILLLPFRRITALLKMVPGNRDIRSDAIPGADPAQVRWAIQAASTRAPWESTCLVQALAGIVMLAHQGCDATLFLGVARDMGDEKSIKAHAWLCSGTVFITGFNGYKHYSVISTFIRDSAD